MSTTIIIDDVLPYTQSVASNGQTVFDTNWTADVAANVVVYARADGVEPDDATQLVSSADYTVTFVGGGQFVRVTFMTGRTLDDVVTITRVTPVDRENLYINTNFTPSMLNSDFGRQTMMIQENDLYDRQLSLKYNTNATIQAIIDTILPVLEADQFWAKNHDNTAIVAVDIAAVTSGVALINTGVGLLGGPITSVGTISVVPPLASIAELTTTENQLLYTTAADSYGLINSANNSVLVTDVDGVPSLSRTIPSGIILLDPIINDDLYDINGNIILKFLHVDNAVNYVTIINSISGDALGFGAGGTDTNIILSIAGQGNGGVQIQGNSGGTNADIGFVGEEFSSTIPVASSVSFTTNVAKNLTSLSLTAGDWDVYGNISFDATVAMSAYQVWLSLTSATAPDKSLTNGLNGLATTYAGSNAPFLRVNSATPITVYLSGLTTFASGACSGSGGIYARRRH